MQNDNDLCPRCGQPQGGSPHASADGTYSCEGESPLQTWPTITEPDPTP